MDLEECKTSNNFGIEKNLEKLLRTKIFGCLVRGYKCSVHALVVQYRNCLSGKVVAYQTVAYQKFSIVIMS